MREESIPQNVDITNVYAFRSKIKLFSSNTILSLQKKIDEFSKNNIILSATTSYSAVICKYNGVITTYVTTLVYEVAELIGED